MKNKTIILLSVLIALMLCVIVAAVYYLYSDVEPSSVPVAVQTLVQEDKDDQPEKVQEVEQPQEMPSEKDADAVPESEKTVQKQPEQPAAKETVKQPAKTQAASSPGEFTVKNCATGKKNTLRQLPDNSLCLIDHNNKQLWKIALPSAVVAPVAEVDIYNNLKIQFLLAEGSSLHCLDRLGREVKGFPMTLPGAVKSGPKEIKSGKIFYWQIDTDKGTVYFDKTNKKIINKLP